MNFNSLTVGSHKLFPKYQIRTGDSKHCTVLMILQDISYIKRVDNKEKVRVKMLKLSFQNGKILQMCLIWVRWTCWILQYGDDLFISLCGDLKGMLMYFFCLTRLVYGRKIASCSQWRMKLILKVLLMVQMLEGQSFWVFPKILRTNNMELYYFQRARHHAPALRLKETHVIRCWSQYGKVWTGRIEYVCF